MSERVGERLEPSLERAKGFGVKVEAFLMKEGWMVGGKTYEGRLDGWKIVVKKTVFGYPRHFTVLVMPTYVVNDAYLLHKR